MLKQRLTNAEYENLHKELKGHYILDGDEYKVDVQGMDALLHAKNHERDKRKEVQNKLDKALTDLSDAESKLENVPDTSGLEEQVLTMQTFILDSSAQDNVSILATSISDSPDLLTPHLTKHVSVEMVDGKPVSKFLDADGKETTKDDLIKSLRENETFKPLIRKDSATGTDRTLPKGDSNRTVKGDDDVRLADLSPADYIARSKQ